MAAFGVGTLAYLDTIGSGLVPCKVTKVEQYGVMVRVTVKVTAQRRAYRHGEIVHEWASHVIPRNHVRRRRHGYAIVDGYQWEPEP